MATSSQGRDRGREAGLNSSDYEDQSEFRYGLRRFLRYSEIQARKAGITPQQHMVLLMVRGHPAYPRVSIGDIAERLQLKHHSASLLVNRSLRRGLLERTEDANDRRRVLVCLTEEGQAILERITIANRVELAQLEGQLFRSSFIEAVRRKRLVAEAPKAQ